jgi:hypothetical protein
MALYAFAFYFMLKEINQVASTTRSHEKMDDKKIPVKKQGEALTVYLLRRKDSETGLLLLDLRSE